MLTFTSREQASRASGLGKREIKRFAGGEQSHVAAVLAPWAYRAAVTPRTVREKSYSGRNVSRSAAAVLLAFRFISPPL